MPSRFAAWIRYGGSPLTDEQLDFAVNHYRVAILQPWETEALERLKAARPDITVLVYKCLSSARSYETGPIFSSGVGYEEAEENGEDWFAHRADGSRIEWDTYPGHWQMAVWEPEYQERWRDQVVEELEGTQWDGVMADNDVFDDYYGLQPPIEGGREMVDIRGAFDEFIPLVGTALNDIGKLLIPNIAESRRDPGRWERHGAYGGGFEESWLAWGPDDYLDPVTSVTQAREAEGPGLTVMRIASDGTSQHRNFTYGLAAFWIFGGGRGGAFSATAHDEYTVTPFIPQLDWDLGDPLDEPRQRGNGWARQFSNGWAGVNFNDRARRKVTLKVPPGLKDVEGKEAPERVTLAPHEGVVYVGDPGS
jgi:Hypothetical glycosyl hydrolase family 15